jgi:hypothetical protein
MFVRHIVIAALTNRLMVHDTIMVFIHQLTEHWFGQGFIFIIAPLSSQLRAEICNKKIRTLSRLVNAAIIKNKHLDRTVVRSIVE